MGVAEIDATVLGIILFNAPEHLLILFTAYVDRAVLHHLELSVGLLDVQIQAVVIRHLVPLDDLD